MQVYVLVESWQYDSGDCGEEVYVYSNLGSAMTQFKELQKQATKDMPDYVSDNYCEGDLSWSRYEDGEYCYNHYDIAIYIRDIID